MKSKLFIIALAFGLSAMTMSIEKNKLVTNEKIGDVVLVDTANGKSNITSKPSNTWVLIAIVLEVLGNHEARVLDVSQNLDEITSSNMLALD